MLGEAWLPQGLLTPEVTCFFVCMLVFGAYMRSSDPGDMERSKVCGSNTFGHVLYASLLWQHASLKCIDGLSGVSVAMLGECKQTLQYDFGWSRNFNSFRTRRKSFRKQTHLVIITLPINLLFQDDVTLLSLCITLFYSNIHHDAFNK